MKIILLIVTCSVAASAKILPDDFPQCKRNDPELEKCILAAVEVVRPRLLNGIPEVNIPTLEPFNVPTLKLDRTANNLRLKANIKNMKAVGGSKFTIEKFRLNLNNKYVAEIKLSIPKLVVTADYDVKGSRILTLDISGQGRFRSNITGITVVAKGNAKPITKDGVEYLQAEKAITKIRITHAQIVIDDNERPVAAKKPVCHYSDPNVAECIKRVAEQAKQLLAHGIPSFGIQPLEPLKIPSIRLRQHNMPQARFKYDAWLTDLTLNGLTNYTFNKLDVYPEEIKVNGNISLPRLVMGGEYVVIGEFQMLPVESTGKMSANFTDCSAALDAVGAKVHKRIVIKDANVKLRCTGALKASLMEAHSTTSEMEMITDHIIQMHASELAKEVQPAVETALAMVLEDIANKFLKHIPTNMVFPI
ncbi:seminal fluid protein CSSFP066 [Danaus plexippus plexippus]|uniref:Seminal fluid protein CSSFP066 n=1 Tax=Danaus plexippus plexippus TaxID=278856 RepID=A0A212EL82_DANPL|nr:seminal fluid protein CSSFP066 [Danaus plexippus plexippus]